MTLFKASHEVAVKLSVLSAGGPVSYLTHVDFGRRHQFNRAANDMAAGNPQSEQCERQRDRDHPPQDRNCSVSYNQTLYMAHLTSAIFQCSQRPTLAPRGGGLTESEQQEVGPLGHLREATTAAHTPLPPHYSSLKSENSSRGRSVTQT